MKTGILFFVFILLSCFASGNVNDNDTTYHVGGDGNVIKGFVKLTKIDRFLIDGKVVSEREWDNYLGDANTYFTSEEKGDTLYHVIVTVKPADCIGKFFSPCRLEDILHTGIYRLPSRSLSLLYFWNTSCRGCFEHIQVLDSLNVLYPDTDIFIIVRNRYLKDFPFQSLKQVHLVWDRVETPVHVISSTCIIIDADGKILDYVRFLTGKQDVERVFEKFLAKRNKTLRGSIL